MTTETINKNIYASDGALLETTTVEVPVQTVEDQIAEKEAKLLEMYEELKALKGE